MKKPFKICSLIDLVKSLLELLGGIALVLVGAIQLSSASTQQERLPAAGLVLLGAILLAIAFCALYWLSAFKKEFKKSGGEGYDFKLVLK